MSVDRQTCTWIPLHWSSTFRPVYLTSKKTNKNKIKNFINFFSEVKIPKNCLEIFNQVLHNFLIQVLIWLLIIKKSLICRTVVIMIIIVGAADLYRCFLFLLFHGKPIRSVIQPVCLICGKQRHEADA